jgi:hypothetical protein
MRIKELCSVDSKICVGGSRKNSDKLLLVSCGSCISILTNTKLNHPIKVNHAYWYLTKSVSFGFSPKFFIKQNDCDTYDCDEKNKCEDPLRLCWYIGGSTSGWRLGNLNFEKNYRDINKLIFLKF